MRAKPSNFRKYNFFCLTSILHTPIVKRSPGYSPTYVLQGEGDEVPPHSDRKFQSPLGHCVRLQLHARFEGGDGIIGFADKSHGQTLPM